MGGYLYDYRKCKGKRGYLALFRKKIPISIKEDLPGPMAHLLPMDVDEEDEITRKRPLSGNQPEPFTKRVGTGKRNVINLKL